MTPADAVALEGALRLAAALGLGLCAGEVGGCGGGASELDVGREPRLMPAISSRAIRTRATWAVHAERARDAVLPAAGDLR